ncbi:Rv2578c family radical SAM protein [Arthrobacter sp. M4]|uniref:Rv2578c family radical SAM protein n=1 Tax=Arthrobacter sp. M4 TaxID=218160 RepID=UPI001CDCD41E|nr:Rv2578c family radical SAM protein [Arthrobacter sp. M4]MCA4134674.1 Rv2578c family radical SAM protein [Arthrobacter sp. M4]
MRWDAQSLGRGRNPIPGQGNGPDSPAAAPASDALLPLAGLVRSISTPEFAGITFHEVTAKSVLNKVPPGSRMPFEWTINPYRGCSHACVYCFARKSHTYLDFDSGLDFDSQVVVKVNAAEVLRRELSRPGWGHHHVALGTNTDPYQRAEGRYQLMPGIIRTLADSGTPLSILTKGTLLSRDIPLLKAAASQVPVGVGISLAMLDEELSATIEPGTPTPRARLALIRRLRNAGLECNVMAMPILPWLTDGEESLHSLFQALSEAGATGVTAGALYLRPGTREWFMQWLGKHHPELVGRYRSLYGQGSYASKEYQKWLASRVVAVKARYGFTGTQGFSHRKKAAKLPESGHQVAARSAAQQRLLPGAEYEVELPAGQQAALF